MVLLDDTQSQEATDGAELVRDHLLDSGVAGALAARGGKKVFTIRSVYVKI